MRRLLLLPLVLLVLAGGVWLGGHPGSLPGPVRRAFVDDQVDAVAEATDEIQARYYRPIGDAQLRDTAINGMVEGLDDRFSAYFSPTQYARFQQSQRSEFSGIGVAVVEDPLGLSVAEVYDGSPAQRAGIKRGEKIVAVAGKRLKGVSQNESTTQIKGPAGSTVRLTIRDRKGDERELTVRRATVTVPSVASRMTVRDGKKIGLFSLSQFGPGDHARVYAAVRELRDKGAKALVFDLRRNGGGLVSEAQLIASAFLRSGPIVTTKGRSVPSRTLNATGDPIAPDVPLVVLVDRSTASASEIVTGALQDAGRATVVGTRTFGKGVFQEVIELSDGGALDITAGQYFTPKGRNLGGRGVQTGQGLQPDVKVSDDPDRKGDEQLRRAVEVAAGKTS